LHLSALGAMAVALRLSLEPGAVVLRLRLGDARRELRLAECAAVLLGRSICVARTRHGDEERHGTQQTENLAHRIILLTERWQQNEGHRALHREPDVSTSRREASCPIRGATPRGPWRRRRAPVARDSIHRYADAACSPYPERSCPPSSSGACAWCRPPRVRHSRPRRSRSSPTTAICCRASGEGRSTCRRRRTFLRDVGSAPFRAPCSITFPDTAALAPPPRRSSRSMSPRALAYRGRRLAMAHVFLDPSVNGGYSYFTDSENNGPWNSALTQEFIPYVEELLGVGGSGRMRFLEGHSSGGWTVMWLQVSNPDFFGAVWAI